MSCLLVQRPKWFAQKHIHFLRNTKLDHKELNLMLFANCPQVIIQNICINNPLSKNMGTKN